MIAGRKEDWARKQVQRWNWTLAVLVAVSQAGQERDLTVGGGYGTLGTFGVKQDRGVGDAEAGEL